jgi:hypothetical protein
MAAPSLRRRLWRPQAIFRRRLEPRAWPPEQRERLPLEAFAAHDAVLVRPDGCIA